MDCFNHLCPFRQNTTSNCNRCECLACQNRCKGPVTYNISNQTLTEDEIARMTNNPDYGVGLDVRRLSDMKTVEKRLCEQLRNLFAPVASDRREDTDAANCVRLREGRNCDDI